MSTHYRACMIKGLKRILSGQLVGHFILRGQQCFYLWFGLWKINSEFLRIAKDVGLYVIVRPGPYICAEWEWGGFPAWLLTKENMIVRQTKSATFLAAVQNWFAVLFSQLREHQWSNKNGGPIISIQVENEYASYNKDPDYLPWVKNLLIDVGTCFL